MNTRQIICAAIIPAAYKFCAHILMQHFGKRNPLQALFWHVWVMCRCNHLDQINATALVSRLVLLESCGAAYGGRRSSCCCSTFKEIDSAPTLADSTNPTGSTTSSICRSALPTQDQEVLLAQLCCKLDHEKIIGESVAGWKLCKLSHISTVKEFVFLVPLWDI